MEQPKLIVLSSCLKPSRLPANGSEAYKYDGMMLLQGFFANGNAAFTWSRAAAICSAWHVTVSRHYSNAGATTLNKDKDR